MDLTPKIDVSDLTSLINKLNLVVQELPTVAADAARAYVGKKGDGSDAIAGHRFKRGGAAGHGWRPLSRKYKDWKLKAAPGQPDMVLSGDLALQLFKSAEISSDAKDSATISMSAPDYYSKQKQLGRNIMVPNQADIADINIAAYNSMAGIVKRTLNINIKIKQYRQTGAVRIHRTKPRSA